MVVEADGKEQKRRSGGQLQAEGVAGAKEDGDAIDVEGVAEALRDGIDEGIDFGEVTGHVGELGEELLSGVGFAEEALVDFFAGGVWRG
jgi:hypothetical protein